MVTKKHAKVKEVGALKRPGEGRKKPGPKPTTLDARVATLEHELRQLRGDVLNIINGLAERVAAQSELLSGRAEATPAAAPEAAPAFDGSTPLTSTVAGYRSQS